MACCQSVVLEASFGPYDDEQYLPLALGNTWAVPIYMLHLHFLCGHLIALRMLGMNTLFYPISTLPFLPATSVSSLFLLQLLTSSLACVCVHVYKYSPLSLFNVACMCICLGQIDHLGFSKQSGDLIWRRLILPLSAAVRFLVPPHFRVGLLEIYHIDISEPIGGVYRSCS